MAGDPIWAQQQIGWSPADAEPAVTTSTAPTPTTAITATTPATTTFLIPFISNNPFDVEHVLVDALTKGVTP